MKVPRTRIASTIADQTLSKGISQEYVRELAAYLLAERRVGELDSILRDVQREWAERGYVEVLARSAHSLTAEVKADIVDQVRTLYPNAKDIVVTGVADPSVVGGVRLDLADQQLDLTVRAKLHKFKQLTKGS